MCLGIGVAKLFFVNPNLTVVVSEKLELVLWEWKVGCNNSSCYFIRVLFSGFLLYQISLYSLELGFKNLGSTLCHLRVVILGN